MVIQGNHHKRKFSPSVQSLVALVCAVFLSPSFASAKIDPNNLSKEQRRIISRRCSTHRIVSEPRHSRCKTGLAEVRNTGLDVCYRGALLGQEAMNAYRKLENIMGMQLSSNPEVAAWIKQNPGSGGAQLDVVEETVEEITPVTRNPADEILSGDN